MYEFIEQRARALAASNPITTRPQPKLQNPQVRTHHVSSSTCKVGCGIGHPLFRCPQFQKQTPTQRGETIKKINHCFNCLQEGHSSSSCSSQHKCKVCNRKHHTMLHNEGGRYGQQQTQEQQPPPIVSSHHIIHNGGLTTGVLATAKIRISSASGDHLIRTLVDGGATNCHITERAAKRLKLPLNPCTIPMSGLQDASLGWAKYVTSFAFYPHFNSMTSLTVTALVVKSISKGIPSERLRKEQWTHLQGLQLADPDFHIPAETEILLGTDIFWGILENQKINGKDGQPHAVKSTLGWLVGGPNITSTPVSVFNANADLDFTLRRFWEQESIPDGPVFSSEERQCEEHFSNTHKRNSTGRFLVHLPFKKPTSSLGSSRQAAITRLMSLERKYNTSTNDMERLRKLTHQWEEYKKFMIEYESLGHMSLIPPSEIQIDQPSYYIPHHCVFKESSTTTKLRVVFDASASTTTGTSLNDCMMVGPTLQDNITDIMLRFRTHRIAFTADIAKMYRQIQVFPEDTELQRIVWREHPSLPIKDYRLLTVTYGTSSAPYLAVKCLQQLAEDEKHRFPAAAAIVSRDFYVDDTASGCDTIEEAKETVKQLMDMCMSGGMELREWTTNSSELLETIPEAFRETSSIIQLTSDDATVKTLGVFWNPSTDKYVFKLTLPPDMSRKNTKRIILSEIAKIFDPLGWLAPATIVCKIFMQELWKCKADWDEVLQPELQQKWLDIKSSLSDIERIEIPRCVISSSPTALILIGCSDASIKAISAVVYLCCKLDNSSYSCNLLTSKTKVAPVKHVTLPRLELNGAVLLSELLMSSIKSLQRPFASIRAFTDSTITLHWIKSDPQRWKIYVRRRVQAIQENVPGCEWFHIPGEANPADCASRGITSSELLEHSMWWKGSSSFLDASQSTGDCLEDELIQMETERSTSAFSIQITQPTIFTQYSSFRRLQRVIAYVIRFINNWIRPQFQCPQQKGSLTVHELLTSHNFIIRHVQETCYSSEIAHLKKGECLPKSSNLLKLNPFISEDGLLRVGGRLRHAAIPYTKKHPILLPKGNHITATLIRDHHLQSFHAGPSAVLATLQHRYWIVNGRDVIRRIIRKCVTCTRHRGELMEQVMGDLPYHRVNPSRPFSKVGIDYAGPFTMRPMVRSKVTLKCWLSIFVCFTTRAIHIEVVSALTTDCFLAAFRRFISRRGKPSDIFSDCGTNFKGANKVLRDFFVLTRQEAIQNEFSSQNITWHFNPAGAPHFGGLWEAGVKSIKHHLVRVLGATVPTYEELHTLVVQIKGILNSRPLIPASTDPSDLSVLTPAHFLIGDSIMGIPEPDLHDQQQNHLKRWQMLQQQRDQFWKRWSNEFITRLQQRPKWLKPQQELGVGHLVIIKDERLPPLKWKMGRVLAVHPGADGHVRVATLKTEDGVLKRPIAKLCLLPIHDQNSI